MSLWICRFFYGHFPDNHVIHLKNRNSLQKLRDQSTLSCRRRVSCSLDLQHATKRTRTLCKDLCFLFYSKFCFIICMKSLLNIENKCGHKERRLLAMNYWNNLGSVPAWCAEAPDVGFMCQHQSSELMTDDGN